MESQQGDFKFAFQHQQDAISIKKDIVDLTMDIVDYVSSEYKGSRIESISAYRFMEMLIKFMEAVAKEENLERLCILTCGSTSGKQPMDEIERLGKKLTAAEYIFGNNTKWYSEDNVRNYKQQVMKLLVKIYLLKRMAIRTRNETRETFEYIQNKIMLGSKAKQNDNEEEAKLSANDNQMKQYSATAERPTDMTNLQISMLKQIQQIMQGLTKPTESNSLKGDKDFQNDEKQQKQEATEAKRYEDVAYLRSCAKLARFRRKLDKFKRTLNEDEIGETIYFLEITKISWEKQMDEINQLEHEVTTVYLLGNDIDKDFEDIEILYRSKLNELNRKINVLKQTEKAEKAEETQILIKFLTQIPTEMQDVMQKAKPEEGDNMDVTEVSQKHDEEQEKPINVEMSEDGKEELLKQTQQITEVMKRNEHGNVKEDKLIAHKDKQLEITAETKGLQHEQKLKSNAIVDHFRRKLDKFRKCLNEDEVQETIYCLETTKASWRLQMDEIKQREYELTTVYLLGNDIDKDFEDIENVYNLKVKELDGKINEMKEIEKAKQLEAIVNIQTETLVKLLKQTQTEMQQLTQLANGDSVEGSKISENGDKNQEKKVLGNIQLQRFRSKIATLESNICSSQPYGDNIYCCKSTKASLVMMSMENSK